VNEFDKQMLIREWARLTDVFQEYKPDEAKVIDRLDSLIAEATRIRDKHKSLSPTADK
jgi:hypothetical protein